MVHLRKRVTRRTIRSSIFRLKSEIKAFLKHGSPEDIGMELTILRNLERSIMKELENEQHIEA